MTTQDAETANSIITGTSALSGSAGSGTLTTASGLRRSGRSRRAAQSYYEDAAKALKEAAESRSSLGASTIRTSIGLSVDRSNNKKKRGHKKENDEGVSSEHNNDMETMEDSETDSSQESSSSSEDESSDDEGYKQKMKNTSSLIRPKAINRKKPSNPTKRVQIKSHPIRNPPKSKSVNQKPTTRSVMNALNALAKKVLYSEEDASDAKKPSLLAALMLSHQKNQRNLHQIASDLVALHNEDPNSAQCALINLLLRSIGGSLETNLNPTENVLEDMNEDDWGQVMTDLVEQMRFTPLQKIVLCVNFKDSQLPLGVVEYKRIFGEFWKILAEVALQEGSLANSSSDFTNENDQLHFLRFDVDLVRDLILRITELISVGQPDVRLSATTATLNMAESILAQSQVINEKILTTKRYLNAAKGAKKKETLAYQYQSLQRTHENLVEVILGPIMQGIFIHRYRDSNPAIRSLCLNSLSNMCLIRPDLLLSDQYLKYFGWLLSDKETEVRIAAVSALLAPLKRYELQQKNSSDVRNTQEIKLQSMEHVFSKFLSRMADCVLDKSTEVQSLAMELLLHMLREGFMDEVEDENLWNQINIRAIASQTIPEVRKNALYFVMEQLEEFDDGGESSEDDVPLSVRFGQSKSLALSQREAQQRIDSLASWLAHALSDGPVPLNRIQVKLANLIVASLREMPEHRFLVTDWSALLEAIADDKVATLDGLTAGDRVDVAKQKVLVQMLANAVALEMGEENSKKDAKVQERLSVSLMMKLPGLMMKFKSDSYNLANLTVLPSYLVPSVFSLPQQKKVFLSLIENLSHVFLQSPDEIVLCNIARSISHLARGDHSRANDVKNKVKEMVHELQKRIFDLSNEDDNEDDNEESQSSSLKGKKKSKSSKNSSSKKRRVSIDQSQMSTQSSVSSKEDNEYVLMINLKRFRTLVKRHDILSYLGGDEGIEEFTSQIAKNLSEKLNIRKGDKSQFSHNSKIHSIVAETVDEGLTILLTLAAWRVKLLQEEESLLIENEDVLEENMEENEKDGESEDEEVEPHFALKLRDRISQIVELCFEQFLLYESVGEEMSFDKFPTSMVDFVNQVLVTAGKIASDLRTLFPKAWQHAASPVLRSLALTEDGKLIGGFVRNFRSQEDTLRMNERLEKENKQIIGQLLLPLSRSLVTNWSHGNRREAGVALAHMTGSGQDAANVISTLSKLLKRMEPVRLLEAHMASLRQSYEDWMDNEPEDLESNRPTDAEMAAFEAAELNHIEQFKSLEQQAVRLSMSLGVGKLSDPKLSPALQGFLKEGIRFAFSTLDEGQEDLVLGGRLSFLAVMSKYLNWIRRKKDYRQEIREELIRREKQLREHLEFNEVRKDDLKILADFRTALGLKTKEAPIVSPLKVDCLDSTQDENDEMNEKGDELGDLHSTPNTSVSSQRMSRGSSLGSIRSKVSSVRSDLSPLQEMERESSSPSSSGQTKATETQPSARTHSPESGQQPIHMNSASSQHSTPMTSAQKSQSTYKGETQSLLNEETTTLGEGTEDGSCYTGLFSKVVT